jgi:hypothetical protein
MVEQMLTFDSIADGADNEDGSDEEVDYNAIAKRQGSCYVKDLKKDERPDFVTVDTRPDEGTINKIMTAGDLADPDLLKYKERLLGNITNEVRMSTRTGAAQKSKPIRIQ